ncbi:hypothetical protein, partial [Aquabacterium sp.]|uniref:hypothetical protein n=1 Tax=Aquabacterium sp. TaxID=1872578 RepID=UPI0025BF8CC4
AKFTPTVSGTAQVTGRLNRAQKASLEWAYLSYTGVSDWTFQIGRKRLPLYYYSDFQDIGYAYNTIRPAPDVYGWDVVNYNGASARYQTRLGDWAVRQDFFAGGESSKNNPYYKLIQDEKQTVDWKNIVGASLELNQDWFTTRLTYVQSKFQQTDETLGQLVVQPSGATSGRQKFYGIAMNADLDNWIIRSEYAIADRADYAYKAKFYLINAGYRIGQFIPTLGFSRYAESSPFPIYNPLHNHTSTVALRYDLTNKSDLKIQYDRMTETSGTPFAGSAKVIAISYDVVF